MTKTDVTARYTIQLASRRGGPTVTAFCMIHLGHRHRSCGNADHHDGGFEMAASLNVDATWEHCGWHAPKAERPDRGALPRGDRPVRQVGKDFDLTESSVQAWVRRTDLDAETDGDELTC